MISSIVKIIKLDRSKTVFNGEIDLCRSIDISDLSGYNLHSKETINVGYSYDASILKNVPIFKVIENKYTIHTAWYFTVHNEKIIPLFFDEVDRFIQTFVKKYTYIHKKNLENVYSLKGINIKILSPLDYLYTRGYNIKGYIDSRNSVEYTFKTISPNKVVLDIEQSLLTNKFDSIQFSENYIKYKDITTLKELYTDFYHEKLYIKQIDINAHASKNTNFIIDVYNEKYYNLIDMIDSLSILEMDVLFHIKDIYKIYLDENSYISTCCLHFENRLHIKELINISSYILHTLKSDISQIRYIRTLNDEVFIMLYDNKSNIDIIYVDMLALMLGVLGSVVFEI